MDKFIIRKPNKSSNNSEGSNIRSASTSASHEEVTESSSSSAKKQKAPKVTNKTRSRDWDKNWRINRPWLEHFEVYVDVVPSR